jgi:tRNA dimethylallyltransferase
MTIGKLVVIGGPTASGKSGLAIAVAEAFGGTVINADSMQVYRDLRILTARPTPVDEARVPHRLYGVLDGAELCSAARWRAMALAEIEAAAAAGRLPVVVGGTGLYLRALTEGLAEIPPVPDEIRAASRALHAEIGGAAFRERLAALDPAGAARLPPGDTQRLIRAYEVAAATGRPLGAWLDAARREAQRLDAEIATIVLQPPRGPLHEACDARFAAMIEHGGALDEVRALVARGLDPALPVMKAVGVRELAACLAGALPLAEAVARAQRETRRYAKRQTTWFRHQAPAGATIIGEQFSERLVPGIFSFIRQFLLTGTTTGN